MSVFLKDWMLTPNDQSECQEGKRRGGDLSYEWRGPKAPSTPLLWEDGIYEGSNYKQKSKPSPDTTQAKLPGHPMLGTPF